MRTCRAKPPTKRFPLPQAALVKGYGAGVARASTFWCELDI